MINKHCGKPLIAYYNGPFTTQDCKIKIKSQSYHMWSCRVCGKFFKQRVRSAKEKNNGQA